MRHIYQVVVFLLFVSSISLRATTKIPWCTKLINLNLGESCKAKKTEAIILSCPALLVVEKDKALSIKKGEKIVLWQCCMRSIQAAHNQDRDESKYFRDMDASMQVKWQIIYPEVEAYLQKNSGPFKICDVGTGTGALAAKLVQTLASSKYRDFKVIGTDIIESYVKQAQETYDNLSSSLRFKYRTADQSCVNLVNKNTGAEKKGADIIIFSSVLHEVYSYSPLGDDSNAVKNALKKAYESLAFGGKIIIRDFIGIPADQKGKKVILKQHIADMKMGTFNGFEREINCQNFATDFKSIRANFNNFREDIQCKEMAECEEGYKCYETNMATAYEFIFRKDYDDSYGAELNERYGFITSTEIECMLKDIGFKITKFELSLNSWVKQNRLNNKVSLREITSDELIAFPDYQMFLVAERSRIEVAPEKIN
jgi:SAM-dependent methyltransferase